MPYFGQEPFIKAQAKGPLTEKAYRDALAKDQRLSRKEGIDFVMDKNKLDAMIAPTGGPAWTTDWINGDHFTGGYSNRVRVGRISAHHCPCRLCVLDCRWGFPSLVAPGANRLYQVLPTPLSKQRRRAAHHSFCRRRNWDNEHTHGAQRTHGAQHRWSRRHPCLRGRGCPRTARREACAPFMRALRLRAPALQTDEGLPNSPATRMSRASKWGCIRCGAIFHPKAPAQTGARCIRGCGSSRNPVLLSTSP